LKIVSGHIVAASASSKESFNSFRYTIDLLFPVASFGQHDNFNADALAAWWTFSFTAIGWFLAYVLVAGLAGIFNRT
jgi:hypothetical protein